MTITKQERIAAIVAAPSLPDDAELSSFEQNISTLESILFQIQSNLSGETPDMARIGISMSELYSIQTELKDQQRRAVELLGTASPSVVRLQSALVFSDSLVRQLEQFVETGNKRLADLKAKYVEDARKLGMGNQPDNVDAPPSGAVDKGPTKEDDALMTDITREELTARLETIDTRMDGRLAAIEATMESKLSSIEQMMGRKFAEFDATLHKSTSETVKWVAGIVLGLGVIGISLMTFLINNAVPRVAASTPAPIIIAVPSNISPPPVAPPSK
jgi:hypothetical protein